MPDGADFTGGLVQAREEGVFRTGRQDRDLVGPLSVLSREIVVVFCDPLFRCSLWLMLSGPEP